MTISGSDNVEVDFSIEWINHASYLVAFRGSRLIVDPWLFGSAFDDGWDLLSETSFRMERFSEITHIWFSHEHPDHFAPPVLAAVPESVRKGITVLFQETADKRVVTFCKKLGFAVIELPERERVQLAPDLSIVCGKAGRVDSWSLLDVDGYKVLNVNDCIIDSDVRALSVLECTGAVDLLLSQFSYAGWIGNPEDKAQRELAAREKFRRLAIQVRIFQPSVLIPFASFVYFSHEENRYLNDSINDIGTTFRYIDEHTDAAPVVMYPGDLWSPGQEHDNAGALERYRPDYELGIKRYHSSREPVDEGELVELADSYVRGLRRKNNSLVLLVLRYGLARWGFGPIDIRFVDTGRTARFDLWRGLKFCDGEEDIAMWTRSLAYILQFEWGIGTVQVNGRFRLVAGTERQFNRVFMIGALNSTGRQLSVQYLARRVLQKLLRGRGSRPDKSLDPAFADGIDDVGVGRSL